MVIRRNMIIAVICELVQDIKSIIIIIIKFQQKSEFL